MKQSLNKKQTFYNIYNSPIENSSSVSIITVVFNGEKYLENTIQSVINQSYPNLEYIIIDGGSTDKTLGIIKQYQDQIDYWISESDSGIYGAMNKGISVATGEWILFLGADDWLLHNGIIEEFMKHSSNSISLIYGNIVYSNGVQFKSKLNSWILLQNSMHHQSCFYHRSLFENFRYDCYYKFCADYEINLIAFLKKIPSIYIDIPLSFCTLEGSSTTFKNRKIAIKELNSIRKKHTKWTTNFSMSSILFFVYIVSIVKRIIINLIARFKDKK